jgi:hypothetical protein
MNHLTGGNKATTAIHKHMYSKSNPTEGMIARGCGRFTMASISRE